MSLKNSILISIACFAMVFVFSLSFGYVEGDDASNIAYHSLGRNNAVQPPYSDYHGMMDKVLSLLPANETVIRISAISITALSGICMYILMMLIAARLAGIPENPPFKILLITLPFIAPEFFFLSLTYTPAVTGMCFVLGAHLLLIKKHTMKASFIALILFGIGVSLRWDCGYYLLIIGLERVLFSPRTFKTISLTTAWIILATASSFLFIYLTGSDLEIIRAHIGEKDRYVTESSLSLASAAGNLLFFTPAYLILSFAGLVSIIISKNFRLLIFLAVSLLFIFPVLGGGIFSTGTLKRIFSVTPILLSLPLTGGQYILTLKKTIKNFTIGAIFILLLLAGFIGIKIYSASTNWGPGFETHIACESDSNTNYTIEAKKQSGVQPGFFSGFVFMTEEGPRPIGGYFFTLFRDWRKFNQTWNNEKIAVLDSAIKNNLPIIQEKETHYLTAYLCRKGYSTNDPRTTTKLTRLTTETYALRNFINADSDTLSLINFQGDYKNSFLDSTMCSDLRNRWGNELLLHAQYSTTIRKLCGNTNPLFEIFVYTPFTAKIRINSN